MHTGGTKESTGIITPEDFFNGGTTFKIVLINSIHDHYCYC